ncbi:MAG: nuclear transport factor 2 family protein [Gammaproteobacteria bacterium]|nr:nuclear transport factor 2 family protein [Gammaproteobacteria bacterium]MDH3448565.1 nuclear transport factor 2 family protein [Gammaproteobacteria bacterium]
MTDTELIELARAYVALSNSHRVELILPMFATGARYTSASLGEFRGQAAIGDMMHGFFADYPDAHWQASNYRCDDHQVSFDFTLSATAAGDGSLLQRQGVEHIAFTAEGSIKKLVVESA